MLTITSPNKKLLQGEPEKSKFIGCQELIINIPITVTMV